MVEQEEPEKKKKSHTTKIANNNIRVKKVAYLFMVLVILYTTGY